MNRKSSWHRIVAIGSAMLGVAILLVCIDAYFEKSGGFVFPISSLWIVGVLCLLIAGAVRWFMPRK